MDAPRDPAVYRKKCRLGLLASDGKVLRLRWSIYCPNFEMVFSFRKHLIRCDALAKVERRSLPRAACGIRMRLTARDDQNSNL